MEEERLFKALRHLSSFDTERALKRVKRLRLRRSLQLWSMSAAACIALAVLISILLPPQEEKPTVAVVEQPTPIGQGKVVLRTASGEQYDLNGKTSTIETKTGTFINENGVLKVNEETPSQPDKAVDPHTNRAAAVSLNELRVAFAATHVMELADGTRVHLNSGTVLHFPTSFAGHERRVRINGEAYFEVTHNPQMPFIVETAQSEMRVLGTEFNVKAYNDEEFTYTTLVKGKVAVNNRTETTKSVVLQPGQQAVADNRTATIAVVNVRTNIYTSWKDGLFYFDEMPMDNIMRMIARWYDLDVEYAEDAPKNVAYYGKVPMYVSVENVLNKFRLSGEVDFDLHGRTLKVIKRKSPHE